MLPFALHLLLAAAAAAATGGALKLPGGASVGDAQAQFESLAALVDADPLRDLVQAADAATATALHASAEAARLGEGLKRATGDAYKHLKGLLEALDPKLAHLGVERVSGGSGASLARRWVCPDCKPGFEKAGNAFVPTPTTKGAP